MVDSTLEKEEDDESQETIGLTNKRLAEKAVRLLEKVLVVAPIRYQNETTVKNTIFTKDL